MKHPLLVLAPALLLVATIISAPVHAQPGAEYEYETRTRPIPITVESFRGRVMICLSAGCSPASVGQTFSEGAAVETGADAFVRLSLPDGSHIALPSNSRMRVDRMRRLVHTNRLDRLLTLEKGRAESEVTPMTDPGSRFVVATPVAVSAVRGTVFRTEYDNGDARGSSGVLRGAVHVSGKATASEPKAGEGVTATPGGVSAPKHLLPAPQLLSADALLTDAVVTLNLKPVPGAARYRVRLTTDAAMHDTVVEKLSITPSVSFSDLANGAYYVQATAITADGLEGLPGDAAIVRLRTGLTLSAPVQEAGKGGAKVTFGWTATGAVGSTYRFVLRPATPGAAPLVDRSGLTATQWTADAVTPGAYSWSVTATHTLHDRKVEDFSDPQPLIVRP